MIWALIISISVFRVADGIFDRESISAAWMGDILIQFLTNGNWTHLWYLYLMVGLYAMMPFYKKIAAPVACVPSNSQKRELIRGNPWDKLFFALHAFLEWRMRGGTLLK